MNLNGQIAIVTGGARGIGKAISNSLLHAGMKLLVCDIDEASGKSFIEELNDDLKDTVIFQKTDVSCFEEMKAAFEIAKSKFGRIDVVINNAGIFNEHEWKRMINVNFIGVINGIHLAFEFMGTDKGASGGVIINIASNAGLRGFDLAPIYSGCKHAVVGLTRSYGALYHFNKTGVAVNAVCPGPVDTELFRAFPENALDKEASLKHNSEMKPISPDDVAKAVLKVLQDSKKGALLTVNIEGMKYVES